MPRTRNTRLLPLSFLLLLANSAGSIEIPGVPGRWSVSGFAEGYGVFRTDPSTQRQRPAAIVDVKATGNVLPKVRLFLDTRAVFGGPPEHAHGVGLYDLDDTFQNVSPSIEIEEGYADIHLPRLDVRVGKQKFAWGRLDAFQPTDVVNPRQWSDPFVTEEQDAKIGVPAVRTSYFPSRVPGDLATDTSVTLVWVPVPVSFRFPLAGERWFPSSIVPRELVVPKGKSRDPDTQPVPPFPIVLTPRLETANRPPPHQFDEGAVALRLAGVSAPVSWSLVYYDGQETAPDFDLSSIAFAPNPNNVANLITVQTLRPRLDRIRLLGGDATVVISDFTVRAEAAYGFGRMLPRSLADLTTFDNILRALGGETGATDALQRLRNGEHVRVDLGDLFVARDTVAWGVGADYRWRGWMPVVQLNQTLVLRNRLRLLVADTDTSLVIGLQKTLLRERLKAQVSCIQGVVRSYTALIPTLAYDLTDDLRVKVGYLMIAGTRNSLIGQFHDNDEGFVQLRYSY